MEFILLALLIIGGLSYAEGETAPYENPTTSETKNLTFNMQQSVAGTGYFAAYRRTLMPDVLGTEGAFNNGVEAGNNAHASGELDSKALIYAESTYYNNTWVNGAYDEDGEIIEDDEDTTCIINIDQDGKITYRASKISIGTQYYADHAIVFDSRANENTWIKNRDSLNSIGNRILDAQGLELRLNASMDAEKTSMTVEEDMIEGRAHFAGIQNSQLPKDEEPEDENEDADVLGTAMKSWHSSDLVLEQDYVGSYLIKQNLSFNNVEDDKEREDSWLLCCSGGFSDMNELDLKGRSVESIFDCTCAKM